MKRLKYAVKALFANQNLHELTYLGKVASTYLQDRAATVLWHEEHIYMARFMKQLPDNLKVIDVPVGTGRFVPFYEMKGWQLTGVDVSPEMLEKLSDNVTISGDYPTNFTANFDGSIIRGNIYVTPEELQAYKSYVNADYSYYSKYSTGNSINILSDFNRDVFVNGTSFLQLHN